MPAITPQQEIDQRNAANPSHVTPPANHPWKVIQIDRLYQRKHFKDWAGQERTDFYVAVPYSLTKTHNIEVRVEERIMVILQGAAPDFTRFFNAQSTELMAYFPWSGR